MEIVYEGESTFTLRGTRSVVINPPPTREGGVIPLFDRRQKKRHGIVNGPGEYEIGGVLISTVRVGSVGSDCLSHAVTLDTLTVVHFAGAAEALTPHVLGTFGRVDVLLLEANDVPNGQRAVTLIDPRTTLLYGPRAAELAVALGVKDPEPKSRVSWNGVQPVPKATLLKAAGTRKKAA